MFESCRAHHKSFKINIIVLLRSLIDSALRYPSAIPKLVLAKFSASPLQNLAGNVRSDDVSLDPSTEHDVSPDHLLISRNFISPHAFCLRPVRPEAGAVTVAKKGVEE